MANNRLVIFDLEGPLSPMDFAAETMGLFDVEVKGKRYHSGKDIFEVISRWDDLLTLDKENKVPGYIPDYEPGETLSWITPHLIYHKIRKDHLRRLSETAGLVKGAKELITDLRFSGVEVGIISTSYEQHAKGIAQRLGVDPENVFCTAFPLGQLRGRLKKADLSLIGEFEKRVCVECLPFYPIRREKDEKIRQICDQFYLHDLPALGINPREMIKAMGGTRKAEGVKKLAEKFDVGLSETVVVADSITDINMLRVVKEAGGLAVVFNGDRFALPEGNVGLATTDMWYLRHLLAHFWREGLPGGLPGVEKFCRESEKVASRFGKERETTRVIPVARYDWLKGGVLNNEVANVHAEMRRIVREVAARLDLVF